MKRSRNCFLVFLLGAAVAVVSIGCSSENPIEPSGRVIIQADKDGLPPGVQSAASIQFESRVASVDPAERKLTFTGVSYVAVATDSCDIARVEKGVETPILFSEIVVGDSARVCGDLQADNTVLAKRIRIFTDSECPDYDLAFRDTIVTIDYAAGSFTVAGRSETIIVDDHTVIWGHTSQSLASGGGGNGTGSGVGKDNRTLYAFTDLAVDHIVEVRANIVSPDTLLAVSIKVANCSFKRSVQFTAYLASIDTATRITTFDGLAWIGVVCPQAALLDLDGQPLTLADFAAGDFVTVKGFPLEADSLFICLMEKTEP